MAEKSKGSGTVLAVCDEGEKLYPNTAAEGREVIRQELRSESGALADRGCFYGVGWMGVRCLHNLYISSDLCH